MRALIAARDLMRASDGGKHTNVNVLDVSARNRKRYQVFRFAGGSARVTADATRVVNDLGPLHRLVLWRFEHHLGSSDFADEGELYHAGKKNGRGFTLMSGRGINKWPLPIDKRPLP
jgi:hypothetical protein